MDMFQKATWTVQKTYLQQLREIADGGALRVRCGQNRRRRPADRLWGQQKWTQ